jgi:hypothetical protein
MPEETGGTFESAEETGGEARPPPVPVTPRLRAAPRSRRSFVPQEPDPNLDLTRVISETLSTFFGNIHRLSLMALAVYTPFILFGTVVLSLYPGEQERALIFLLLLMVDGVIMHHMLTAVVSKWAGPVLRHRPIGVGPALAAVLFHPGPTLLLAVRCVFAYALGVLPLLVPAVFFYTSWFVGFPVLVEEGRAPGEALRRSSELTRGNRLAISFLVGVILMAIWMSISPFTLPLVMNISWTWGRAALFLGLQILVLPIRAVITLLPAVVYHELRVCREGLEIEELASVFD